MTVDEAVAAIDALSGDDAEADHGRADDVLLAIAPPAVRDAYDRLTERAPWWAAA